MPSKNAAVIKVKMDFFEPSEKMPEEKRDIVIISKSDWWSMGHLDDGFFIMDNYRLAPELVEYWAYAPVIQPSQKPPPPPPPRKPGFNSGRKTS